MKNLNLLLLGAAAIGGFYLYNRSKKESPTGENTDFEELELRVAQNESRVAQNESSIISNTNRIGSAETSLADALQGEINIEDVDLSGVYTKEETDALLNTKQPAGQYILESSYDDGLDELEQKLEGYADDAVGVAQDGIEANLANDFYTKSQIDSGFQVKGNYASEGYVDDAMDEAKSHADAEDVILKGELETFANSQALTAQTSASSYADNILNQSQQYADSKVSDLETTIEDNYAQLNDLPVMSEYATLQYVDTGLQGKQPAGNYVSEGDVDEVVDDALESEDFLTLQQAEGSFYPKSLGDFVGQFVLGSENYPTYSNAYAPNVYPPVSSSSAPANFSGFRFSAW